MPVPFSKLACFYNCSQPGAFMDYLWRTHLILHTLPPFHPIAPAVLYLLRLCAIYEQQRERRRWRWWERWAWGLNLAAHLHLPHRASSPRVACKGVAGKSCPPRLCAAHFHRVTDNDYDNDVIFLRHSGIAMSMKKIIPTQPFPLIAFVPRSVLFPSAIVFNFAIPSLSE